MPVCVQGEVRRLTQVEFSKVAYQVMGKLFEIHGEFGRLFDEEIYRRELLLRLPESRGEVRVDVSFGTFRKTYLSIEIRGAGGAILGHQQFPLLDPETGVRVTTVDLDRPGGFEHHLRRFLSHAPLQALQWINISRNLVTFKTLTRS